MVVGGKDLGSQEILHRGGFIAVEVFGYGEKGIAGRRNNLSKLKESRRNTTTNNSRIK